MFPWGWKDLPDHLADECSTFTVIPSTAILQVEAVADTTDPSLPVEAYVKAVDCIARQFV